MDHTDYFMKVVPQEPGALNTSGGSGVGGPGAAHGGGLALTQPLQAPREQRCVAVAFGAEGGPGSRSGTGAGGQAHPLHVLVGVF